MSRFHHCNFERLVAPHVGLMFAFRHFCSHVDGWVLIISTYASSAAKCESGPIQTLHAQQPKGNWLEVQLGPRGFSRAFPGCQFLFSSLAQEHHALVSHAPIFHTKQDDAQHHSKS